MRLQHLLQTVQQQLGAANTKLVRSQIALGETVKPFNTLTWYQWINGKQYYVNSDGE